MSHFSRFCLSCSRFSTTSRSISTSSPSLSSTSTGSFYQLPDRVNQDPNELTDEEQIAIKRDISRISRSLRNRMQHVHKPPEIIYDAQKTKKYQAETFTRYGKKSGIDARKLWPTVEELQAEIEDEKLYKIPSLQEAMDIARARKEDKISRLKKRESDVYEKMKSNKKNIEAFKARLKKEAESSKAAKIKENKLLEEAREILGYDVDPKDEKFKELMEKRAKEEKKAARAAKKKAEEQKYIARLSGEG